MNWKSPLIMANAAIAIQMMPNKAMRTMMGRNFIRGGGSLVRCPARFYD
jgi:hypothetical protein